ncbi:MAG: ABC transporter substrate-binding protein [Gemmatimonadota bacterium]
MNRRECGARLACATVCIGVALASSACAGDSPPRDRGGAEPGTIRLLYEGGDLDIFNPAWDDSPKFLLFQPLATRTGSSCVEPAGSLAERWERSDDWLTWTVTLRSDVRWHDGTPVTARDVVFNLELWRHPDVGWYGGSEVAEAEAMDERTVRLRLHRPGSWPLDGWYVFFPAHHLEAREPARFFEWDYWQRPIGNGPFRYVRHVPETMVELEANPDYPGGRPAIERVIIRFRGGSPTTELLAGNIDLAQMDPLQATRLASDPRFRVYYGLQGTANWVAWNHRDPRFADPRVRRAMAHAVDRRALAASLAFPDGLPITDAPMTPCQRDADTHTEPWPHDPAEALRLLEEAGWRDSDGDGILDREGQPFRFPLISAANNERAAVFLEEQLRRIGIIAELRVLDRSLAHRRFQEGNFAAIIPTAVHSEWTIAQHASPIGPVDEALADLLDAARAEPDPARGTELMMEAGKRYRDLAPAMFLHFRTGALVAHRRVQGLGEPGTLLARQGWRWPFGGLEHLWIEE